ncbi:Putative Flp pilus-assembly TadE/G-like [Micromonospora matsumotoense]|uniref:Putative Flp pilus-assembly TadE/G-like n=1 Tax=Micromonospora matsumotoense TaxID=121616 RepID=A0A1C4TWE5_9ACTN|nr:pilus assembly protein TadG-related protein [Micromonospora matsumotoense]SCE63768.1 Putative Flp pilus-assembly TadE/G-like [Micromonospora matsumotoense]
MNTSSARRRARRSAQRADRGAVTAFTVVWLVAALLLGGLVLDAGLAVSTKVNARSVANAAARAGARELDVAALRTTGVVRLDPAKARTAAASWIARAGLPGTVTVTATTVTVSVTTSRPTQLLGLAGIGSIAVHSTVTADAIVPN